MRSFLLSSRSSASGFVTLSRMKFRTFAYILILSLVTTQSQARLVAHYDFGDGDLLDNEVSDSQYRLEQRGSAVGAAAAVLLNRAEGIAVFPGGVDALVWLEASGVKSLPEFTFSFWFRTDQVDQRMAFLGLMASGRRGTLGSWQLHSDSRSDGNFRFRSGESLTLYGLTSSLPTANEWHHVVLRKERSKKLEVYVTAESSSVGSPGLLKDDDGAELNEIVLGAGCERRNGYRMDLANVRIYDSAEVSVRGLFREGPQTRNPDRPAMWHIGSTLTRLNEDVEALRETLSHLPSPDESLPLEAYGCHSSYLPTVSDVPDLPRWTVSFDARGGVVREVYLVPAADRRTPSMPGYGFPQRFRLIGILEGGESSVLVDWKNRDFPDPGRFPARLIVQYGRYTRFRLEVYRGHIEDDKEFFALDEILVRGSARLIRLSNLKSSGSFEMPPFWSEKYLIDGKTSMGLPVLPERQASTDDFVATFSNPNQTVSIEIELPENRKLEDIVLYPAQHPDGAAVPGYGFPGSVKVEFVKDMGEKQPRILQQNVVRRRMNPGNNAVRLFAQVPVRPARWIRFTFSDLPQYEGQTVFGLGEMGITYGRESISVGCRVHSDSFPPDTHLQMLTDGVASGRLIVPVLPWLDALAQRGDLSLKFNHNRDLRRELLTRQRRIQRTLLISCISLLVLLLASATLFNMIARRRQSERFRQRVSQDLHDDIGSKIGAILLAATFLRKAMPDPQAQESSRDIEEIADDMKRALRDVLWFTNSQTDRLRELVCKLKEVAQYSIPDDMLSVECVPLRELPELPVRVEVKRELMMLFKEALHNATKHAQASRIGVAIRWTRPYLYLCVRDNGQGFDVKSEPQDRTHLGLAGMRRRAKRLRADLCIQSNPGMGTIVELTMKVRR